MKVRKTVTVEEDVWWGVKKTAMERQVTVSEFVEDALKAFLPGAQNESSITFINTYGEKHQMTHTGVEKSITGELDLEAVGLVVEEAEITKGNDKDKFEREYLGRWGGEKEAKEANSSDKVPNGNTQSESEIIINGQKALLKKRMENQAELDKNGEALVRDKGESNASWQIRKKARRK